MKFIVDKYYTLLAIVVIFFAFNIFFRERLINWIFNTSTDQSVTDAAAYARETMVRNIFSYCLMILLIAIAVISFTLLFTEDGKNISKVVLIGVPVFVAFCFFLGLISGSFS